jgi:glutathione synthase/RimK-type ligase-like ATP-grasp enzyme
MFTIAIHPDDYTSPTRAKHDDASSPRWTQFLTEAGCTVRAVDVYSPDILESLAGCDAFMWRWAHFWSMHRVAKRLLPVIEHQIGLHVYPSQKTSWHFDDKAAQAFVLRAAGIPTPETWVFFSADRAHAWADQAAYPVVHKLVSGAGSTNVSLVKSREEAHHLIDKLFTTGCFELTSEQPRIDGLRNRVSVASQILKTGTSDEIPHPSGEHYHRNEVYFQKFVPGNNCDIRITVIGNRAFGFRRLNRDNDFRASGSGKISFDPAEIPQEAVRLAFQCSQRLQCQSMAYDILMDDKSKPVVVEISYTYASWAVHQCPGHWQWRETSDGSEFSWIEGAMWPERAQVDDLVAALKARRMQNLTAPLVNTAVGGCR